MAKGITHKILPVGPLQCNCSILICDATQEAVLIDPGDEGSRIWETVSKLGVQVKYLIHTHAHFDHVGGTAVLKEKCGALPCLHAGDKSLYENVAMQGRMFGIELANPPAVEKWLEDGEVLAFGEQRLEVLHTPGHSPGGVCLRLSGGDEMVFSGDSLFQGSIGRTDLWGADTTQLLTSIRQRLFTLDDDLPVHPGHGPSTLIGIEKRENPFLT